MADSSAVAATAAADAAAGAGYLAARAEASSSSSASTKAAPGARKRALKIFYQGMHERNIHNVKLLISTVLPVTYNDSLFKKLLTHPAEFCKLGALQSARAVR